MLWGVWLGVCSGGVGGEKGGEVGWCWDEIGGLHRHGVLGIRKGGEDVYSESLAVHTAIPLALFYFKAFFCFCFA
jgi:hypothetical protein